MIVIKNKNTADTPHPKCLPTPEPSRYSAVSQFDTDSPLKN